MTFARLARVSSPWLLSAPAMLAALVSFGCVPGEDPPIDGVTTTNGSSATASSGSSASATATATGETSGGDPTDPEPTGPEPTGPEPTTSEPNPTTSFVPDWDFGPGDPCDPWLQDCPEGEKCVPYSSQGGNWDANKCVPVLGDQAVGEPCTWAGLVDATDDCDATSICWDVNPDQQGTCVGFCTGTPDDPMCPPGSSCLLTGPISICISTCDPIVQDCGDGTACYWVGDTFNCIFTTADLPPGEACGFINDCATGSGCVAADSVPGCNGASCCTPFCDLDAPGTVCDVLPGSSCVPFFAEGDAPPGYASVGMCMSM